MIRRPSGGGCRRGLLVLLAVVLVPLALVFYRLPQALLTWVFPNDYVYRFTVSVTLDGKTYTGETVSGCRVTRSAWPDKLEDTFGSRWYSRVWATPLTVALPENRFLLLRPLFSCQETSFRRDPAWKGWLGLLPDWAPPTPDRFDLFPPPSVATFEASAPSPVLFDDAVSPRNGTVFYSREGAEAHGVVLSLAVGPATWREVERNLERKSGAPWLAPAVVKCLGRPQAECALIHRMGGFHYIRLTLAEAMQEPTFAAWADSADRSQPIVAAPEAVPSIAGGLSRRFGKRPTLAFTPDWSTGSWIAAEQRGLAHIVSLDHWPSTLREPTLCPAPDRCVAFPRNLGSGFTVVDWTTGQVLLARATGHHVFRFFLKGETP